MTDKSRKSNDNSQSGGPGAGKKDAETPWSGIGTPDLESLDTLSRNMMDAALMGNQAFSRLFQKTVTDAAANPVAASDPAGLGETFGEAWRSALSHPDKMMAAQSNLIAGFADLWSFAARRSAGETAEPVISPDEGDKRFRSRAWSGNPYFDVIKQAYLLNARFMHDILDAAEDLDPKTRRKAEFFTNQFIDALSPSNFALTNPDVLEEIQRSKGESLVRGMVNLMEDLERGEGKLVLSQTDLEGFVVGEDLAATPGEVMFKTELFELIQYTPATGETYKTPLLIFPPWINKYYILDMREGNSMIRWLVSQGFTVFLVSWVNPDTRLAGKTFEDYIQDGIFTALDAVEQATGETKVNTVGYCIGGTLLASALALMGQRGDGRIKSATFFAAQTDFTDPGDLAMFTEDTWLEEIERIIDAQGGILDGRSMADTFNMLRANDLVWSFYVNNYLLGREPRSFDLLFWNADQTRMPKYLHMFYLRRFYRENALSEGGLELFGQTVSLSDIGIPCYVQAAETDHIAPYPSVYRGARKFGGKTRFMLAGSGHIAGVINPPEAKKYHHWTNAPKTLPETAETWLESAERHEGSWWPDWKTWLAKKSGDKGPARKPGDGKLRPLYPAPGEYVRVKS